MSKTYVFPFSFYDKKRFSSKKEQKTIDASEKVVYFLFKFTCYDCNYAEISKTIILPSFSKGYCQIVLSGGLGLLLTSNHFYLGLEISRTKNKGNSERS